jgi:hypothetical protein
MTVAMTMPPVEVALDLARDARARHHARLFAAYHRIGGAIGVGFVRVTGRADFELCLRTRRRTALLHRVGYLVRE